MKKLLEVRRKSKAKKPSFIRHDAHKKKRISSTSWRRPKGRQNKMRLAMKGYARSRSTGFSSPQKVSGLSPEGLVQRLVVTKKDFENLDAKTDGIIFSKTVGAKKKLELIEYAQKNNFTILNLDATKYQEKVKQMRAAKSSKKKEVSKRKEAKEAAKKKASASKKESATKEATSSSQKNEEKSTSDADDKKETDKKTQEKKEQDKILTKGDQV